MVGQRAIQTRCRKLEFFNSGSWGKVDYVEVAPWELHIIGLGGIRPGEARLVLKEDDNLYLNVVFPKMAMLPGIGADAKVVAVDVNENVTMYDNDDFVERFETGEGIIRTRYFLKRRRILSKIHGRRLRKRLLEKYRGRGSRRVREIYYRAARGIIGKALEVKATVIVMEDLRHLNEEDKGSRG